MLGVCLDYPLHFFSHLNNSESSSDSLKRIWPTLRLGVISSVLAYIALMGTGFSGLTQLAVFSAVGLIIALLVTRWLLPTWVSVAWIRKQKFPISLPFSINVKISVSIALLLIPLILLVSQNNIWSNDISQISPIPEQLRLNDRQLRQDLHAINVSHLFLIDGTTMEQVLIKTAQLKQQLTPALEQQLVTGILTASDLLPSEAQQHQNQSLLPIKSQLQQNVDQALVGLAFKKNTFHAFINYV
jgi:predicted exporter